MSETDNESWLGRDSSKPSAYRVVLFGEDGRVQSSVPLPVHDDESAQAIASTLANGVNAELWDGLRCIASFQAT